MMFMDERIIKLKAQIISDNIEKIFQINSVGVINFNFSDELSIMGELKDYFLTSIITDGKQINITATNALNEKISDWDARFMDLEELDYNISSILDKLIESTKD